MTNEDSVPQPQAKDVLRALRDKVYFDQVSWAEEFKVDPRTVGRWEAGENLPREENVTRIIDFCLKRELLPLDVRGHPVRDKETLRSILTQPRERPQERPRSRVLQLVNWISQHRLLSAASLVLVGVAILVSITIVVLTSVNGKPLEDSALDCESLRIPLSSSPPDFTAKITTPNPCSTDLSSGVPILTSGTYQGDLAGNVLWLLVYAPNGQYYVQSSNACGGLPVQAGQGRWSTTTHFGEVGMGSEKFDIVLTVSTVESEANQVFSQWLRDTCVFPRPGFMGELLPQGLAEVVATTVRTSNGHTGTSELHVVLVELK